MPQDTRRLPVPDDSKSPQCFAVKKETTNEELVNKAGKRRDGRKPEQIRPLSLQTGVISKAKGSGYIELGNTKVICAVYGPREVIKREDFSMTGQLQVEYQAATFSRSSRGQHQTSDNDKVMARHIEEALLPAVMLDKFPKARMDIFITVLEDDGSCMSAALTCASLALSDAGVEMYDLVVGSSLRQQGNVRLLDPTVAEEYKQHLASSDEENVGEVWMGYMASRDQISALSHQGSMDLATLNKAIKVNVDACQRIHSKVQECIVQSIQASVQTS